MTTINPAAESKLHRFESQPAARWIDDPDNCVHKRYRSVFAAEGHIDEPSGVPVYDPKPAVHTD